jgi:DNA-binding NarL/FixJ family response regulator
MYVLRDASHERRDRSPGSSEEGKPGGLQLLSENGPPVRNRAPADPALEPAANPQILIYLDAQAFTRDCVGYWLQSSLSGFHVCLFQDPEQIMNASVDSGRIRAVLVNTGPGRMSSGAVAGLLARVGELLPTVPVAVLSDYEDAENIREAFALGVRGYIPTSLASMVAVGAMHLVCVGGTFAPPAILLSQGYRSQDGADEPRIEGFTQRQAQILDCLRRGMANKVIAYELNMCESTVKVHVRNIMKKLKATNRTQIVYLTRGFFENAGHYQRL